MVRQFAAERLATEWPALDAEARSRQSAYYLGVVQRLEAVFTGPQPQPGLAELSAELDNIRLAWDWAVAATQIDTLAQTSRSLVIGYELLGLVQEGAALFETATAHIRSQIAHTRAGAAARHKLGALLVAYARFLTHQAHFDRALAAVGEALAEAQAARRTDLEAFGAHQAGHTLARQAHYGAARVELERALRLARTVELPGLEADCLFVLGETALWQGDLALVWRYHPAALEQYRALGNRRGAGRALNQLSATALLQGHFDAAQRYATEALACVRQTGSRMDEGLALLCLGQIAIAQRDYRAADTRYEQAVDVSRAMGDRHAEIFALSFRGQVPLHHGEYRAARAAFEHALRLFREIGDRRGENDMLAILGLIAHLVGDDLAAQQLAREALALAEHLGIALFQARAVTVLGHALLAMERHDEAIEAYRTALTLRRRLDQHHLAMEPLAGLARVALAQGDLEQAQVHAAEIGAYLAGGTLAGTFEPLRVYLTWYEVLRAADDPDADKVLRTAHELLHDWAASITDPEQRRAYLEHVAVHRALEARYAQLSNRDTERVPTQARGR